VKYFMCEQKRDYCMADSKILKRSSWQRWDLLKSHDRDLNDYQMIK
jgi:hypothetical protein